MPAVRHREGTRAAPAAEAARRAGATQFVVGDLVHRSSVHGDMVQRLDPAAMPRAVPRPRPRVSVPPPPRRPPLGREDVVEAIAAALAESMPVELCAARGSGGTALLDHLAASAAGDGRWPDGVVHLRAAGRPAGDVVQWLFEAFWHCERPWAPGPRKVGGYLREIAALVVLDDVVLGAEEAHDLVDAAPRSAFLLATGTPCLAPEFSQPLAGLPGGAALQLLERMLGRPFRPAEWGPAVQLVATVDGLPSALSDAAALVRGGVAALDELRAAPPALLARRRADGLADGARRVLGVLREVAPAALSGRALAAAADDADAPSIAEQLAAEGLVARDGPRFAQGRAIPQAALAYDPSPEPLLRHLSGVRALDGGDAPGAVAALRWGMRAGCHAEVLAASRAVEVALGRALRPASRDEALALGIDAAERVRDGRALARLLHQRGTVALSLGYVAAAEGLLTRALDLRRRAGDDTGAAVTRHNLELVRRSDATGRERDAAGGTGARGRRVAVAAAIGRVAGALGWPRLSA